MDWFRALAGEHVALGLSGGADSVALLWRCVAQGLGVSCLSRVLVQAQLQTQELEILPTTLPRMWRYFSLVQRAGKRRSPALAAFVQACHQMIPKEQA